MRWLVALGVLAACGDNKDVPAVPLVSGSAQLAFADGELVLRRDGRTLLVFARDAFQIGTVDDLESGASFDPYWLFVDGAPAPPDGFAWSTPELRVLASDAQSLVLGADDVRLTFRPSMAGSFAATFSATGDGVAYLRVRADADASEGFYGLGEWGDGVNHRGKLRPTQIEVDLTLESSNNENHVPVPLVIGTRGWGLFVASDRPGAFDVARESDTLVDVSFGTAEDSAEGLAFHLFTADAPLDIFRPYFEVTGYPGVPAMWAYGPLLWRDEHRDQAQVLDDIQQIRTLDLATSGIWFDRPYASGVNTFDWDPTKFSDPTAMLQALHAAGLRYAIWQAPYVAPAGNQDPAPAQNAYATQMGFFPPVTGVTVNQWGKPIDFTNPAAYAWWKMNLETYTRGFGVEGFKLDYGEDIVLGISGGRVPWQFADGSDERTMHYGYTMLYHQIHREALGGEGFLLTRTGRWGDQTRGVTIWPGDLDADLSRLGDPISGESTRAVGGLPTALAFGIGLSASGFPFYASDTGGYRRSPPNNETWLRWVEANAVWPAMQVGDSSSEMPWEFTAANGRTTASLDIYRRYARLHMRLFPYVWTYAQQMRSGGRPIVRPVGLAYPELDQHPADQYLLGDSILSAPVITAGQTARDVWLPPGTWLDWWTGAPREGGMKHTVDAPLDTLPLFLRAGGIVPLLRDTIDTLAPVVGATIESFANNAGVLFVRVAPGASPTVFAVYDGSEITQGDMATALSFKPGTTFTAGALFEVIGRATSPTTVRDGATALTKRNSYTLLVGASEGWFWDAAVTGGTLWIKVPGAATLSVE